MCNAGYYRAVLASNDSGLEFGSDVCVPCNETCAECYGPESVLGPNGCQSCRYALQLSQCVSECTGKLAL